MKLFIEGAAWVALSAISIGSLCLTVQHRNEIKNIRQELEEQNTLRRSEGQYQHNLVSETLGKSRKRFLHVKNVVGDGVTDDTRAIKRALNKAYRGKSDAIVVLPKGNFKITKPLVIKGGVTLQGQGYGPNPLQLEFVHGGSVLSYCGDNYALNVIGHSASIQKLAIFDSNDGACGESQGAVRIYANSTLVESITMRDVLIYQFMDGTSITLEAENAGGIGYASFENIRIRHAKVGIHLNAKDEGSFVNSNAFHDGAISGGITDIAVLANGPGACNDNQFNGMVIEPPKTSITHVYVSGPKSNIRMNDVRLEGSDMPADRPLVIIADDSYGNVMNGMLGHTFVQADLNRNPDINFNTNKMVGLAPSPQNLFWNAAFHGLNEIDMNLPGWTSEKDNLSAIYDSGQTPLFNNHKILQLTYEDNASPGELRPVSLPSSPIHSFVSFGVYAQSTVTGSIVAAMKFETGSTISSSQHTGSGKWEFIGMSSLYDKTGGARPYFSITGNVKVTAPTFVYGHTQVSPGADFISSSGARMFGSFTMNSVSVSPQTGDRWILPTESNIFDIQPFADTGESSCSSSTYTVQRFNDEFSNRFEKSCIITVLFPPCGGCVPCLLVKNNPYISLLANNDFSPDPASVNANLVLMSIGDGSWREISRNGL